MKTLGLGFILLMLASSSVLAQNPLLRTEVKDHFKTVIVQTPYKVELCANQQVSGDKTGDTLGGAVIGGLIGKALTGDDNAAGLGALFGGIIGHQNSQATGGTQRVCRYETRYKEESKRVYSYSIVTFWHQGQQYQVKFLKNTPLG